MKLYFILAVITIAAAFTKAEFNPAWEPVNYSDTSAVCPVTGDPVTAEYIEYRYIDKDVKFCNDGCVMAFKKEPAKYSEHVKCMPCNDDDGKHAINTTHNGVKYYFCGEGCKGKFEAEPEAYIKKFMK